MRAIVLAERARDYVRAARAIGAGPLRIMLPPHPAQRARRRWSCSPPSASARRSSPSRALSFLGLGVQPPTPTWGWTLSYGLRFLRSDPWMSTVAGLAIMLTVLGFNLLGDGLRDQLDPRGLHRPRARRPQPLTSELPMPTIHRHRITVFADGTEAVLHIHEIVGGAGAGPTVGISAAIHGDEQTGPQIILDFARGLDASRMKGRLLLLPVANPRSFEARTRHNPVDDLNLNRMFPAPPAAGSRSSWRCAITRTSPTRSTC